MSTRWRSERGYSVVLGETVAVEFRPLMDSPRERIVLLAELGAGALLRTPIGSGNAGTPPTQWIETVLRRSGGRLVRTAATAVLAIFSEARAAMAAAGAVHDAAAESLVAGHAVTGLPRARIAIAIDGSQGSEVSEETVSQCLGQIDAARVGETLVSGLILDRLSADARNRLSCDPRTIAGQSGERLACFEVRWRDDPPTPLLGTPHEPESRLVIDALGARWIVDRERPRLRIGRGEGNEVQIDAVFASRRHASIEHRNAKFYLTDRSSNGTLITRTPQYALHIQQESLLLEGRGAIRLGRLEGPEIRFAVEVLAVDGRTWQQTWAPTPTELAAAASTNVFRREGDYWTLVYQGAVLRLKDTKGLHYLAHLVRNPGVELHVLDLALVGGDMEGRTRRSTGDGGQGDLRVSDGGDAGPLLDATAKAAYRQRLADLREELADAEQANDIGRAESARREIELLAEQLAAAVGLGARDRRAASHVERARVSITIGIRSTLKKIAEGHPALGRHLRSAVRTGRVCSYDPGEDDPVWNF